MCCVSGIEHCTCENVANITENSASVITEEKQNCNEEDLQTNTYDKNEANRSIE